MNANDPWVTAVIPCLNRAHYLIPTLESILRQDYPFVECIVVDGGSRDGTVEILRQYGDRIKWVSEPDRGHADAINKGWWMGKGEILAWLNADDLYVVPDAISKAIAYLKQNPRVDVVYGAYSEINETGQVLRDIVIPPEWNLVRAVKYCHYTVPQATSFMRRSILERVNWLSDEYFLDHDLWLRIGLVGMIKYIPVHLALVRKSPGLSRQLEMGAAEVRVIEKFFKQPGLPAPFNTPAFQRRAVSNSFFVGGLYIWFGTRQIKPAMGYLLRAIAVDPLNLPFILLNLGERLLRAMYAILPYRWRRRVKGLSHKVRLVSRGSHS